MKKLTQHIYYMEHDSSVDRPVLGYIRGTDFSIMVDAGNSVAHVKNFLKELLKRFI